MRIFAFTFSLRGPVIAVVIWQESVLKYIVAPLPFLPFLHVILSLIAIVCCSSGGEGVTGGHVFAVLIGFPSSYVTANYVSTTPVGVYLTLAAGFVQWGLLALLAAFVLSRDNAPLDNSP